MKALRNFKYNGLKILSKFRSNCFGERKGFSKEKANKLRLILKNNCR